jgi:tRNA nucleotidyltransferase (CCA-adding enzyme)
MRDGDPLTIPLPTEVATALASLIRAGAEAALVGGCVRDLVRGVTPGDWDIATSLPPETVSGLFAGSTWQNRFGTVTVRPDPETRALEITTYRIEGGYRDHRRPEEVRWGGSLHEDLARRDFTINAMAWVPEDLASRRGHLADPFGGAPDMAAGVLRTVGDPDERFGEDALRLLRAVRFANRFELRLDPATEEAIRRRASDAAELSGERIRDELLRVLAGRQPPSRAFELMERLGLLEVVLPELAALRDVPQAKALPGDALDHSLRTADALPAHDEVLRLAGLLHDLGKATTLSGGHFLGHDREGAVIADAVLRRLRMPRRDAHRVMRLVEQHMFTYTPDWTDAAVRRFVRRVGVDLLEDLFALRAADNVASGAAEPASGGLAELRERARAAVSGGALEAHHLAVDGNDLMAALDLRPGPIVGRLLTRLLEAVIEEPALNRRDHLLALAGEWLASDRPLDRGAEADSGASSGDLAHRRAEGRTGGQ